MSRYKRLIVSSASSRACPLKQFVEYSRGQHDWYVTQIAVYKHLNGVGEKRSWMTELIECLTNWHSRFPNSGKSKGTLA
jgi:hypothetical protein